MNMGDAALVAGAVIGLGFAGSGAAPMVKQTFYDDRTPIMEIHSVMNPRPLVRRGATIEPVIRYSMREACQGIKTYVMTGEHRRLDGSVVTAILGDRPLIWPPGQRRATADVVRIPDWVPAGRYRVHLRTTGRCSSSNRTRSTSPGRVVTNKSEPFHIEIVNELSEIPDPPRVSTSNATLGEIRLPHISP